MGEERAKLNFLVPTLYEPEVCVPYGLDQADSSLLWNGEAEDFRVNLADDV
jgi:hypothetical protein